MTFYDFSSVDTFSVVVRQHRWLLAGRTVGLAALLCRNRGQHRSGKALLYVKSITDVELPPISAAPVNCKLFLSTFACGAGPVHHCQASVKQPLKQQGKCIQPGIPDISELSPELQQEWHPDNNDVFGGFSVKPHSNFRAKWECKNCPTGHPHIFFTKVCHRTDGSRCPYCQGRRACAHNCLATISPSVARFWNYDKNAKTPEETLAGSHVRAAWRCPD